MKNLLPVLLLLAAIALGCSGSSGAPTTTNVAQSDPTPTATPDPEPTPDARVIADAISKHTTQTADEVLSKTDIYCRKIADLKIGKTLTQGEFLYIASVMVDAADNDQKLRKRFTLDRRGRYDYEQIATAVYLVSLNQWSKQ